MPASARVAIATFMPWRTVHSRGWDDVERDLGVLDLHGDEESPGGDGGQAGGPGELLVVICMVASVGWGPWRVPLDCLEPRKARGEPASPDDVTGGVRSSAGRPARAARARGRGPRRPGGW